LGGEKGSILFRPGGAYLPEFVEGISVLKTPLVFAFGPDWAPDTLILGLFEPGLR
jgi:hypothetical protein